MALLKVIDETRDITLIHKGGHKHTQPYSICPDPESKLNFQADLTDSEATPKKLSIGTETRPSAIEHHPCYGNLARTAYYRRDHYFKVTKDADGSLVGIIGIITRAGDLTYPQDSKSKP
ncbi:hypothetical protein BG011_001491 [Mortierella polycephala]|uniref:Uncharacterized protein n=1 Tax=Mortierella polycephala TaxID=41804 RepID=A0A9P6U9N5_9FUNG|nr:hypothetical protein BG011_001491 [Mortierella polycephala]